MNDINVKEAIATMLSKMTQEEQYEYFDSIGLKYEKGKKQTIRLRGTTVRPKSGYHIRSAQVRVTSFGKVKKPDADIVIKRKKGQN